MTSPDDATLERMARARAILKAAKRIIVAEHRHTRASHKVSHTRDECDRELARLMSFTARDVDEALALLTAQGVGVSEALRELPETLRGQARASRMEAGACGLGSTHAYAQSTGAAEAYEHAAKIADAALAQPPRPVDGWEGIESAPKDGTEVLGYWDKSRCMEVVSQWPEGGWDADGTKISAPTHWQPLPAPPGAGT